MLAWALMKLVFAVLQAVPDDCSLSIAVREGMSTVVSSAMPAGAYVVPQARPRLLLCK